MAQEKVRKLTADESVNLLATESVRTEVNKAVKTISAYMSEMALTRESINDVLSGIEERYGIPKKFVRKIANQFHKQNAQEEANEASAVKDMHDQVSRVN